jgi:hypothetical protein
MRHLRRLTPLCVLLFSAANGWGTVASSNTNPITIALSPANGVPYPSDIAFSGLSGTLNSVAVSLNGWTDNGANANPDDLYFMLAAPGGQTFEFLGGVGGSHAFSNLNLVLSDSASATLSANPIVSGTYKPTDLGTSCTNFPTPAPPSSNCAAPDGTSTFAEVFDSSNPNGTWSLYEFDSATGDTPSSLSGGWALTLGGVDTPEPRSFFTLPTALLALLGLRRYARRELRIR